MAPQLLAEYVTFSGEVLEHHIGDESAGSKFQNIFSVSRFRSAFPNSEGLPLLVGLDFEWKPDKTVAQNNPIALMQFACWDTVFILRTTDCSELPQWMTQFLESGNEIVKVTASFDVADKRKLQTSFGWDFERAAHATYWDVAELANDREVPRGMFNMAAFLKVPIQKLKAVGSSNWARANLTDEQRAYAADDAFFQLYLLGRLLEFRSPESTYGQQIWDSWQKMRGKLEANIKTVDNSGYVANFNVLRGVVRDAVEVLSKALGSGGCTNLNDILKLKPVKKAVAAQKVSPVHVNAHFLRQNSDIFVLFFRRSQLCVRLRHSDDESGEDDAECADLAEEDVAKLISDVQEKLAAYKPPSGKKQSVLHRSVPEPLWVPARAILSRTEIAQFESCSSSAQFESIETSYDAEDGLLLRLARHPRAPDDIEYMQSNVQRLGDELQIDLAEAKRRLGTDAKFMEFWSLLRTVEVNSQEEAAIARCLSARGRILVDSQRLAIRLSHASCLHLSSTWVYFSAYACQGLGIN